MPALQGYNRHQKENGFNILFKSLQQGIPELQENLQACSVEVPGRTRQISCSSAGFGVRGGSGVGGGAGKGGGIGGGRGARSHFYPAKRGFKNLLAAQDAA